MTQSFLKLVKKNNVINDVYSKKVVKLIRQKYNQNDENAIIRKRLAGIDYNNEFIEYNNYVEWCKSEVKKELEL